MRKVFISAPSYDQHEAEMMQAMYRRAVPEDQDGNYFLSVEFKKGCSLLAGAFNEGLCSCQNQRTKDDLPFDYWLLLHGDVEPADGFVHTLVEELERNKLDALHAVVPIKDNRGITSTGIGPITRKWSPTRKITTTELRQLPETFTVEDCMMFLDWGDTKKAPSKEYERIKELRKSFINVSDTNFWPVNNVKTLLAMIDVVEPFQYPASHPFTNLIKHRYDQEPLDMCLLANTGCLLLKLDKWAWEFPGFVIEDRRTEEKDGKDTAPVLISKELTRYTSLHPVYRDYLESGNKSDHWELSDQHTVRKVQNVPEDWGFSRWMARKGLRVGATTKVTTTHWGKTRFVSSVPWGGERTDQWFLGCKEEMEAV